jgi:4,5-dihydroxyphthalate decarboxylase
VSPPSVNLKIAIGDYPHTASVLSGEIAIAGVTPEFIEVKPIIGAFRRMVRNLEFDVCEMAPTTYLIARSRGAPFIALPIFVMRTFHHDGIVCAPNSGIATPKDLEGKRVGVRAYSVTTGVWKRGIMAEDFGLDPSKVTWVVDDEEAVPGMSLPPNVIRATEGRSLVSLFAAGELEAAFTGPAGIGRQGPPEAGWNAAAPPPEAYGLFKNGAAQATDWHRRTGVYPHHGLIVVKESLLAEHPWLAESLYQAFLAAKDGFVAQLRAGDAPPSPEAERYARLMTIVGDDPLPYGVTRNTPSIEALARYAAQQGLIPEPMPLARAFVPID